MNDVSALLTAILADPREDAPRLILADALDERGLPGDAERAAVTRNPNDPPACRAYAAWLESRGATGLLEFAALQTRHLTYSGKRTLEIQGVINRTYDALQESWRRWLPASVTTLTRKADRWAYCSDWGPPAVRIPSRRRGAGRDPVVTILYRFGMPQWVECDEVDWQRCGLDLLTSFPWLDVRIDP